MPSCSIINCLNRTVKVGAVNKGISYHRFPTNPHYKNKWIEATGRKRWLPTKNSRLCSLHFHDDTFTGPARYRRLIRTACPTIDIVVMSSSNNEKAIDAGPSHAESDPETIGDEEEPAKNPPESPDPDQMAVDEGENTSVASETEYEIEIKQENVSDASDNENEKIKEEYRSVANDNVIETKQGNNSVFAMENKKLEMENKNLRMENEKLKMAAVKQEKAFKTQSLNNKRLLFENSQLRDKVSTLENTIKELKSLIEEDKK